MKCVKIIAFCLLVYPCIVFAQINTVINPNGWNVIEYPNGRVASEGMYRDGKPDGYWRTYHVTGILASEGNRLNFLLDSTWVFYTVTGDTAEIINYRLGRKSGYHYIFETITERNNVSRHYLKSRELFLDDRREGTAYYFYPNGNLRQTINFRNGRQQGDSKVFDENGNVITLEKYQNGFLTERQHINRLNTQGERHGVWMTFHDNGVVMREDFYRNGVLDGISSIYSERGLTINQIVHREGVIIEEGIQFSIEPVDVTTYWEDGITIRSKGTFLDTIAVGFHYFYTIEGNPERAIRYSPLGTGVRTGEGSFDEQERRVGEWRLYAETGELRSTGRYVNDRQHGEWTFYSQDGKRFQTGNFNNGVVEGIWVWYFPSGNIFREEMYERGRHHGLSVQYSDSATIVVRGEYVEGERDGFWIEHVGDIREEGNYSLGEKDGVWRSFHRDEKLYYTGNFIQGNPDGRHLFYFPDGILKEEQRYVMGRRYGIWRRFHENGTLFLTITYNDDLETRINGIRIDR